MVDFEQALKLAKQVWDGMDYYAETDNAFIFSLKGQLTFGGMEGPIAVMKDDGRCMGMSAYVDTVPYSDPIREGYIAER